MRLLLKSICLFLCIQTIAKAGLVRDQGFDQFVVPGAFTNRMIQSFTPTADNVAGVDFMILGNGVANVSARLVTIDYSQQLLVGPGPAFIVIPYFTELAAWSTENLPNNPNGSERLIEARWAPVAVTPGATYYLELQSSGPVIANQFGAYEGGGVVFPLGMAHLVPLPPGDLPAVSSTYDLAFRTYASVPDPNLTDPFTAWAVAYFNAIQLANPLVGGLNADPDGDGRSNLVEYALGGSPLVADPAANGELVDLGSGNWVFRYTRPAARAGLVYLVESTPDLGAAPIVWTPYPQSVVNTASGIETVEAAVPAPANFRAARLRITYTP
jgi:hypothetical protein